MASSLTKILLVGATAVVLAWSGLQVYAAKVMTQANQQSAINNQQSLEQLGAALDKMPAYKLTFLGARLLNAGDYELAKVALKKATEKDRFYPDAFRYYAFALQATGENDAAELALRRAKTLDPTRSL